MSASYYDTGTSGPGGPPETWPATRLPPRKAPALTHVQARFAELQREALRADAGLRLRDDPEDVHDLRVATRRLRALLRTARPMFDRDWADRLRAELDFLASALGAVRDLDVLIARVAEDAAQLDEGDTVAVSALSAMLRPRRTAALAELQSTLESAIRTPSSPSARFGSSRAALRTTPRRSQRDGCSP